MYFKPLVLTDPSTWVGSVHEITTLSLINIVPFIRSTKWYFVSQCQINPRCLRSLFDGAPLAKERLWQFMPWLHTIDLNNGTILLLILIVAVESFSKREVIKNWLTRFNIAKPCKKDGIISFGSSTIPIRWRANMLLSYTTIQGKNLQSSLTVFTLTQLLLLLYHCQFRVSALLVWGRVAKLTYWLQNVQTTFTSTTSIDELYLPFTYFASTPSIDKLYLSLTHFASTPSIDKLYLPLTYFASIIFLDKLYLPFTYFAYTPSIDKLYLPLTYFASTISIDKLYLPFTYFAYTPSIDKLYLPLTYFASAPSIDKLCLPLTYFASTSSIDKLCLPI